MREALLYDRLAEQRVRCRLCAHGCTIAPGRRGICGVRENREGTLFSLVYGRLVAEAVDPIEKKPLFHFHPGSTALSIATAGCNLSCRFCQNADISQTPREEGRIWGRATTPEAVVQAAQRAQSRSIAYTYSDPTVFAEYALAVGRLARAAGIANVWVTNGFMSSNLLDLALGDEAGPLIDAANVDLKAFTEEYYRQQCGARLQPVLDNLIRLKRAGVWIEVTTLVIPGLNDGEDELRAIARFICDELGADTPWHVSRFYPTYRLTDRPPTPAQTVTHARELGRAAGLHHVYVGNVPWIEGENTFCAQCGRLLIERAGFSVQMNAAPDGLCPYCGAQLAGVFG
ncbi:MAG: AmmeMemoRadiSam system radical SAM enzyme [Anaerolineales bacterium]